MAKSYLFDIGNPRRDGKRNIWRKLNIRGYGWEWVIVYVAGNKPAALDWIRQQEKEPD